MADLSDHPQRAFELIDLINAYREANGVQPLYTNHILMDLSQDYTDFLVARGQFSHTADGRYPWTRIDQSGFVHAPGLTGADVGNENLHYSYSSKDGPGDPEDALNGWINSSGHNRNMLDPDWDSVGIGYNSGLYTANFGDAPGDGSSQTGSTPPPPPTTDPTPPESTAEEGSFGPSLAVTYSVDPGQLADFAIITFDNVVDEGGPAATIVFQALLDGKVVGTATADVPEPGGKVKFEHNPAFDGVRVKAGEPDVTGIVANVDFTLLPSPTPDTEPEPTAQEGSFGPSLAVTYEVDPGRLADSVTITLEVEEERGSIARILLEALLDGKVVSTATRYVREPGGNIEYNPRPEFDEIRLRAGESDVIGKVTNTKFNLLPEPAPSEPSPGPTELDPFEQMVIDLTNAERAKLGIAPLISNAELNEAADRHAEDMAANNYFSHTSRDGDKPWDRAEEVGYSSNGFAENIARGQRSPEQVVDAWMNSSGHRKNILNSAYKDIGVGYEDEDNVWVQKFGTGDTNPDSLLV